MSIRTAFVTGGTGFIGSHLVEELLRQGVEPVRCLVRTDPRWLGGLPVEHVRGDLFDDAIEDAVRDVDVVFHNAGVTRARDWDTFRRGNVDATVRLMDVIARVNPGLKRVVVTSSLAVVGACPGGVATETTPLEPISRYGRSKVEMEEALAAYADRLPLVIVRPPAVYGPREADIFTFFKTLKRGICPVVGSASREVLSLVYVRDLVQGMVEAARSDATPGETYFLGSETFYSWNDVKDAAVRAFDRPALTVSIPPALVGAVGAVVEAGARIVGKYPPLNREKAREIRDACKKCSIRKAQRDFDYHAPTPLTDGVAETIRWYRDRGWL